MPRIRRSLYFAAFLLVIPVLACGGGGKKSSSGESSGGAPPGSPSNSQATAIANEFAAFGTAFSKVKSFKATVSSNSGSGPDIEASLEVQPPDRYHVTSPAVEIIAIGKDTYVKAGANWVKSPSGGGAGSLAQIAQLPALATAIPTASISKGGTETVNGTKCQLYSQAGPSGTTEYCIANNLPIRLVVTSGTSKSTVIFSDYDKPLEIKAPI